MQQGLIKAIDRLVRLFRANGYIVDIIIKFPYDTLLIIVQLKPGDAEQVMKEVDEAKRVGD